MVPNDLNGFEVKQTKEGETTTTQLKIQMSELCTSTKMPLKRNQQNKPHGTCNVLTKGKAKSPNKAFQFGGKNQQLPSSWESCSYTAQNFK